MNEVGIGEAVGMTVAAVFVVGCGLAVSWGVVRLLAGRSEPDPRAVLAERLARGEITRAEFDTAMRALGYGER